MERTQHNGPPIDPLEVKVQSPVSDPVATQTSNVKHAPRRRDRICRHYRKWWWLHLIVFVIIVLVVILPVIYVGYPNIAQNDINRSTLNLTSISIANPTADSFLLSIELLIGSSSSFHPRISAFNSSVSLATAAGVSSPFTTVIVPPLTVANHATLNVSQTVQLAGGGSGFEEYAAAVFSDAEVSINVYGKPNLKEGALPTISVVYNKTVTINGLDGLKGFDLTSFHVIFPALSDGTNMNGTVLIPNPSIMSIEMGNLTFSLSVKGTEIGNSYLHSVFIRPGDNILSMTSIINETLVIGMLSEFQNGIIPIDVRGTNSVYAGQELSYFSQPLRSLSLTTDLNITAALADVV